MSIFASRSQQTIDVPFDPPHTVTIQKLAGRHVEQARQEQMVASMAYVKRVGGIAEFRKELATVGDGDAVARQVAAVQRDPARQYARSVVLEKGITAWTYDPPPTPETIADLDDQAADWLFHAILDLTFPNGDGQKKTST